MVAEAAFKRATAVFMLDTVGLESFHFSVVFKDGELYCDLSFRCEEELLEAFRVFEMLKGFFDEGVCVFGVRPCKAELLLVDLGGDIVVEGSVGSGSQF